MVNPAECGTDANCQSLCGEFAANYSTDVGFIYQSGLYSQTPQLKAIANLMCFVSFVCFALIVATIYRNQKLQAHPMRLFLVITSLECYLFCSYVMAWDPINAFQYKLFAATVFFQAGNWQKNY